LSLGFVVGGALLPDIIFSYPGIGFALLQAVQSEDFPLMQGIFLVVTVAVLGANFLGDILYVVLDPRVRQEGEVRPRLLSPHSNSGPRRRQGPPKSPQGAQSPKPHGIARCASPD